MPFEVGANPVAVTEGEIYRNIFSDLGYSSQGVSPSMDNILHDLDLALWRYRPQAARDAFEATYGVSFTVAACTTVKGSNTVTTTNNFLTSGVALGTIVTGTGIPPGTFVRPGAVATSLSLSQPATAAGTVTLTFYPPCQGETFNRGQITTSTLAKATSGTLVLQAISLPVNCLVTNFNILFGTTGDAGPANQWMGLYDSQRNLLAISADGTTTAVTASTVATYPVATVAAGSATSFTTTYSGLYYIGFLLVTTNAPTFCAQTGSIIANALPPILAGTSTASLTSPSTFPTQAGTITGTAARLYMYLT